MDKLSRIENECGILLPEIYKDFYNSCSTAIPDNLIGTDLINNNSFIDLRNWAYELLTGDRVDNFVKNDDFVFMMHQGYVFWYFSANNDPDPIVYGYFEGRLQSDNCGHLSDFIIQFG